METRYVTESLVKLKESFFSLSISYCCRKLNFDSELRPFDGFPEECLPEVARQTHATHRCWRNWTSSRIGRRRSSSFSCFVLTCWKLLVAGWSTFAGGLWPGRGFWSETMPTSGAGTFFMQCQKFHLPEKWLKIKSEFRNRDCGKLHVCESENDAFNWFMIWLMSMVGICFNSISNSARQKKFSSSKF